ISGAFTDTVRPPFNEPLWSLPYELWLYAVLALIVAVGGRRNGIGIVLGTLLVGAAWTATPVIGEFDIGPLESSDFFKLGSFFLSGAALAVFWSYIGRYAFAIGVAGGVGNFVLFNSLSLCTAPLMPGGAPAAARSCLARGQARAFVW